MFILRLFRQWNKDGLSYKRIIELVMFYRHSLYAFSFYFVEIRPTRKADSY